MQHFPDRWSMQTFLTSGIGPDILIKVFEGYIILLISAGWLKNDSMNFGIHCNTFFQ